MTTAPTYRSGGVPEVLVFDSEARQNRQVSAKRRALQMLWKVINLDQPGITLYQSMVRADLTIVDHWAAKCIEI